MRIQLVKLIFLTNLALIKKILDLAEFKLGKKSEDFIYFKKQIFDYFYTGQKKLYETLEDDKIVEKCECKSNLRQGYSSCEKCGGSGYKNKSEN